MFTILFGRAVLSATVMVWCYVGLHLIWNSKGHERGNSWIFILLVVAVFFLVGFFVGLHYFKEAVELMVKLLDVLAARL